MSVTRPYNPFTPGSSSSDEDVLSSTLTLEEGLRRSQLRGLKNVERKFYDVNSAYKDLHGEALAQQPALDSVEANTLKTALLTSETVSELKKTKDRKNKRLRMRIYCIGLFFLIIITWFFIVIYLPHRNRGN